MPSTQSRRYCFTLNNPTTEEATQIAGLGDNDRVKYLVVGRETGESGTPHLQGFIIFTRSVRFNTAKGLLGNRVHLEPARGSNAQASDYCKKDGDFDEYGSISENQGKRTDIDKYSEWLDDLGKRPTEREVSMLFPSLYARYSRAILRMAELRYPLLPELDLENVELRQWQRELEDTLINPADDRKIYWVVDPVGNQGKSFFCNYMICKYKQEVCFIRPGKLDDMALTVDPESRIFIFDIPRSKTEFFQYAILEYLKDRMVFSPKYESKVKYIQHLPHVVVFANEHPEFAKLSMDRWEVITLGQVEEPLTFLG